MEFKGEDFIKKVQLKQEKETLKQRLNDLEEQDTIITPPRPNQPHNDDLIDLPEQELGDILLSTDEETTDKKKYIILGLVLVVLFLITIVVIRLVTNSDETDNDSFVDKKENISQDKVLDDENIEQQYQKIINQKLKKLQDEKKAKLEDEEKKAEESLNIKKVQKEEIKTPKPKDIQKQIKTKEIKKELMTLKEQPKVEVKKITQPQVKKEIKKTVTTETKAPSWPVKKQTLREPNLTDFTRAQTADKLSTSKSTVVSKSGYFVQVGAFSKAPSKKYLDNIKSHGYSYKLHKVEVKGKNYTKVLIGPYKGRSLATNNMAKIKAKLGITSAFVLKL